MMWRDALHKSAKRVQYANHMCSVSELSANSETYVDVCNAYRFTLMFAGVGELHEEDIFGLVSWTTIVLTNRR